MPAAGRTARPPALGTVAWRPGRQHRRDNGRHRDPAGAPSPARGRHACPHIHSRHSDFADDHHADFSIVLVGNQIAAESDRALPVVGVYRGAYRLSGSVLSTRRLARVRRRLHGVRGPPYGMRCMPDVATWKTPGCTERTFPTNEQAPNARASQWQGGRLAASLIAGRLCILARCICSAAWRNW